VKTRLSTTLTLHVFFKNLVPVPVPLSVRKNNFQICQLTHSPHVLTRESDGKLVPETDKNMLKNKLSKQPANNKQHTPPKK
jgi:hypothetical protein